MKTTNFKTTVIGIISSIIGIILILAGNASNNDAESKWENFFETGNYNSNPGTVPIIFGVIFLVFGILVVLYSVLINGNSKSAADITSGAANIAKSITDGIKMASGSTVCPVCGERVKANSKFCNRCGAPIETAAIENPPVSTPHTAASPAATISRPASNVCPFCGGELRPGAVFCGHCGKSLTVQTANQHI